VELSDYCVFVIQNAANMAEMCGLLGAFRLCIWMVVKGRACSNQQFQIVSACQDFKMCLQFCNQTSRKPVRNVGGLGLGAAWVWVFCFGFGFFFLIFENQGMLICRLTSDLSAVGRHPALYAECRFGA